MNILNVKTIMEFKSEKGFIELREVENTTNIKHYEVLVQEGRKKLKTRIFNNGAEAYRYYYLVRRILFKKIMNELLNGGERDE
jgi:hypothetical protein